jgi:hypothetical protein
VNAPLGRPTAGMAPEEPAPPTSQDSSPDCVEFGVYVKDNNGPFIILNTPHPAKNEELFVVGESRTTVKNFTLCIFLQANKIFN